MGLFSIQAYAQVEIEDNEIIPHKNLAISYTIGRDGTLTAMVEDDSFTVTIPQIANQFWKSITKTVIDENIIIIDYTNGQNTIILTLNMTDNILHFDLEGRLVDANLLSFQFSENTKRLGENRTGLRLADGREFYFDWSDINLDREYIEGSKSLRVDIRSAPTFKLDPRISITNPDFETGDFTGWSQSCGADSSQSINSTNPINGSESYYLNIGSGADNECGIVQTYGADDDVYIQHQFIAESSRDVDDGDQIYISRLTASSTDVVDFRLIQNDTAGGLQFALRYSTDSGFVTTRNSSFPLFELNTLYCVEYRYFRNTTANGGQASLWVNNTQVSDNTIDNDGISRPGRIRPGLQRDVIGIGLVFRIDDIYIDAATPPPADRVNTCPEGLAVEEPPISPFNIQTALPIETISQMLFQVHGGTSGGLHHFALQEIFQEHNSFSNWIEAFRDDDIIRLRLCPLPTPVSRNATNHIIRFTALSRGTGGVERMSIHILNSTQDIIQEFPETDISRIEFETHNFTLTQANADAIDDYSLIFIELHATNLSVNDDESIFITQAQLDIPETDLTVVCIPEEEEVGQGTSELFPLAPLMNLFFIIGGFILVFNAKGRLEFQASGMFFFLASLLFIISPIYAILDSNNVLSYEILNYPDSIRNNFVLINFVFIGLGLTSVIINNKGRLGFRN